MAIVGATRQTHWTTDSLDRFSAAAPVLHRLAALAAPDFDNSIGLLPTRGHGLGCSLLSGPAEQLFLGARVDARFFAQRVQPQVLQQCAYRLGNLFLKFFLPTFSTARSGSRT